MMPLRFAARCIEHRVAMRIHELAGRLHVGAGSRIGAVTWFPVWSERGLSAPTAYIPRDGRHLTVRECPCPQVNRLLAVNTGASPLLLLQGATLRGGSQDRTCVTTVLVPPAITMEVPVACIERGRWTAPVDDLRLADPVPPRVRARNTAARQRTGSLDAADQAGTWAEVDALFHSHGRSSATDSYHDLRRDLRAPGETRVRPLDGQRGVAVGYGGTIRTVELFGSHRDLATMLASTLESTCLEAAGDRYVPVSARRARQAVAELARREVIAEPAVGWGEDLRGTDPRFATSGLSHAGTLLHLAAFSPEMALAT